MNVQAFVMLFGAYLLGAVPFGLIVARVKGVGDIRQQGSGNIGATNVLRVAGRTAGAIALVLDIGKGALATAIALFLFGQDSVYTAATVVMVFLGHLYPVYLGFKGGKGVAVALGAVLVWVPVFGLIMVLIWLATAKWLRISSLAALLAFGITPFFLFWLSAPSFASETFGLITLLVFWRHRANIQRLFKGTEPSIGKK
ncbi:MAG: glycerol-3-phosphate 1-O-acyltransferase PlsY [Magnetococcales bacterium]|nr:glycerol-3-phosphate 1-O-acyltransferase PlsY [Magnetococcales bacterium]MBF0440061.1 glycerol-3-phosphate 1-O-acyltransferase PlsY [Magnetococcales bacterium]